MGYDLGYAETAVMDRCATSDCVERKPLVEGRMRTARRASGWKDRRLPPLRCRPFGTRLRSPLCGGRREPILDAVSDVALRGYVLSATSWTDLLTKVGYAGPVSARAKAVLADRIECLGVATEHFRGRGYNGLSVLRNSDGFAASTTARADRLRHAATGIALAWFAERGCVVSLPVEPATYDLVVDHGGIFHKVQVKSSTSPRRSVGFSRTLYGHQGRSTASSGKAVAGPYMPGEVDYFFVVLSTGEKYLIPYDVIGTRTSAVLGDRYAEFRLIESLEG